MCWWRRWWSGGKYRSKYIIRNIFKHERLYMIIVLTAAYGGVVAVLLFFATSVYFVTSIIPWIVSMMNR